MAEWDQIQRFLFEQRSVRGELVQLKQSYEQCISGKDYPPQTEQLLGECLAAVVLLGNILKLDGLLSIQAKSDGPIGLLMAEYNSNHSVRALVRMHEGAADEMEFQQLFTNGHMVITIDPREGERYQGIVPLMGESLSVCLEGYFRQSEQLDTHIQLMANGELAAGFMLQAMPATEEHAAVSHEDWEHLLQLSNTLAPSELFELDKLQILHRLFHEETLRVFDPADICFRCSCSQPRTLSALRSLGREEVDQILSEQGSIQMDCQFCGQEYRFFDTDVKDIFPETSIH